jgi:carbamoyltransferase
MNLDYFSFCTGLTMTNHCFDAIFGGPARRDDQPLDQRHMDLVASIQAVMDEVILRLTRSLSSQTGLQNLCLAGGVALNCVANGKVLRDGRFKKIFIQPAAGDAGGALGAAFAAYYDENQRESRRITAMQPDAMQGACLGPHFEQSEIEERLRSVGGIFCTVGDQELIAQRLPRLPPEKQLAGIKAGWNLVRARSAIARSLVILVHQRCRKC